jgi:hypothetical protein
MNAVKLSKVKHFPNRTEFKASSLHSNFLIFFFRLEKNRFDQTELFRFVNLYINNSEVWEKITL